MHTLETQANQSTYNALYFIEQLLNTMLCQCIVHSKRRIVVGKGKFKMTVYNFVSQREKKQI